MIAEHRVRALIVTESYWGNTAAVSRALADGLGDTGVDTTLISAGDAPEAIDGEIALLLIGAPTHNMALPNPGSRRIAASRGVPAGGTGVREWIEGLRIEGDPAIFAFDTYTSRFSGSAARTIIKLLHRRRIDAELGERFLVTGEPPVLVDGGLQRASAWAAELARGLGPVHRG